MKGKDNPKIIDEYDYLSNAASSQDCTGLIPSEPVSEAELESYEDLYHFLPPDLQLFAFICNLSFDIYVKKQIVEKLLDTQIPPVNNKKEKKK